MIQRWADTTERVRRATGLIILGVPMLLTAAGCAPQMIRTPAPRGIVVPAGDDRAIHAAVQEELGPAAAEALPPIPRTRPQPNDPGADALLRSILTSLERPARGPGGVTRVAVGGLRNQSHCSPREFATLRQRLARLLSRSGRSAQIRFVEDTDQPVDYELLGTAYLLTANGFDQWELYLRLRPADQAWTIWRADPPVRMLRQPRPGERQILFPQ